MKKLFPFAIAALLFASCDKIEGPYSEKPTASNDTGAVRKVLLEDYTGQKCGNCPRAAETIESIKAIYGSRVISIGVHAGFFAEPSTLGNKFLYDFRTPEGNELDQYFGNSAAGLPNGMVNRKQVSGSYIQSYNNWATSVSQIINTPPDARIKINTAYDSTSRVLTASINTTIFNDLSGNYRICAFVTEDSIVNWQRDYSKNPEDSPEYVHHHVLRASMNSAFGTQVGTNLTANQVLTNQFSITLGSDWVAKHCSVVVFLHNFDTKEVIQVEDKAVVQ